MENASKALIIAGAILLAIVIISLGLVVINNTRSVTDNANLNEQEIQTFNAKFTSYEGTKVEASKVNTLISAIIASNQAQIKAGTTNFVDIDASGAKDYADTNGSNSYLTKTGTGANEKVTGMASSVFKAKSGKIYKVTLEYASGLVSKAKITE